MPVLAVPAGTGPRLGPGRLETARSYYLSRGGLLSEPAHARSWRLRHRYYAQADPVRIAVEPTSAELVPVPRAG